MKKNRSVAIISIFKDIFNADTYITKDKLLKKYGEEDYNFFIKR